jgi:adenine deaminase
MLCSDDKHPDQLLLGHIDSLVRRALARGSDLFDVLQAAAVNAVRHYGLDVGLLQPGDGADFLEVDDLHTLRIRTVFVRGELAAMDGATLWPRLASGTPNAFAARPQAVAAFAVPAGPAGARLRVIDARDGQLVTGSSLADPRVVGGCVMADPTTDVLKIALVDRYADRHPVVAFIRNFGLRRGAIASSVAHDSHNILAVGTDDASLTRAVNLVIGVRGGLAAVADGREELLPLPIAGLMSDLPGAEVAARYAALDRFAKDLGSPLAAPFMTLAFMALLVIPALKLAPQRLFDVERFAPVGLFVPTG